MAEIKMELERRRELEGKTMELYKVGRYEVKIIDYETGWRSVEVINNRRETGLPEIYCRDDLDGNILGFDIQTTSYGSIPAEEIRVLAMAMMEAAEVAEFLSEKFASKKEERK